MAIVGVEEVNTPLRNTTKRSTATARTPCETFEILKATGDQETRDAVLSQLFAQGKYR